MTWFCEEMLIFNICIHGFMCSVIKKSWKVSSKNIYFESSDYCLENWNVIHAWETTAQHTVHRSVSLNKLSFYLCSLTQIIKKDNKYTIYYIVIGIVTFYGCPVRKLLSLHGRKSNPNHCDEKKKLGLELFPLIRTIFLFLDPN